ncbi:MAG: helix-turn-helix domain-containing protein [Streptosporangiales bacterium]|nr:helix-turn-helix domain-containing protein [Streptosporangiales bacterium]
MGGITEGFAVEPKSEQRSALLLFAQHLRRLRFAADLTQEECAARLNYSAAHFSNLETGRRMPQEAFVRAAEELLGGREILLGLWRLARDQVMPSGPVADFFAAEEVASSIHTYQAHLMPGLLQHPAYTRAVMASHRPPLPATEVEARVAFRTSRQEVLARDDPPWLWAVIDEAVLHRALGGVEVMRSQLDHLLGLLASHTITVQVLPFAAATSPAMGTSFTLLSIPGDADHVYVDTLTGGQAHRADASAVGAFQVAFDYLREAALSAATSVALIERQRKEFAT